eukprot:12909570-Prorocentrum_lima.AAC.1
MMKYNVTSELAVLEGTVPNSKEMQHMERNTIDVNNMLQKLKEDVKGNERGLRFLSDQVDQLEQNPGLNTPRQPDQQPAPVTPQPPTPLPVPEVLEVQADHGHLGQ